MLKREDGHVLRKALDFEVEGQRRKGRLKRTWRWQVEEESMKAGLRREDALCRSVMVLGFYRYYITRHSCLLDTLGTGVPLRKGMV